MAPTRAEEWRAIRGCPGYEVSDCGSVRSFWRNLGGPGNYGIGQTPRLMKPTTLRSGHLDVKLRVGGRYVHRYVHRLVLEAFDPDGWFDGAEALHRDDVPSNNVRSNLYWGTQAQNMADRERNGNGQCGEKNHRCKYGVVVVDSIREMLAAGVPRKEIAAHVGVRRGYVTEIALGLRRAGPGRRKAAVKGQR